MFKSSQNDPEFALSASSFVCSTEITTYKLISKLSRNAVSNSFAIASKDKLVKIV